VVALLIDVFDAVVWLQEYPDLKVVKVEHDANKGLVEQYKVRNTCMHLQAG
jgi:hypothetical protein